MALLLDNARRQVRAVAQWLNLALETSGETQARILYQPLETALIRVAVDLRIFNALSGGQKGSKSLDELASVTKADPALLGTLICVSTSTLTVRS
ncbi:hypothetical protein HO173_003308 [Letharia columbiana]|uniref:Uncharacterized protein n=1 Tax=Letharia columbiana TaxID=112416 RepID=A0A8H6G1R6_9LECA|nr:uncharacterized protein HO173_003308 [Letharia columbiana]KAF6238801.1 hypothetical protein HO173_003308 [Letharia columbiana]